MIAINETKDSIDGKRSIFLCMDFMPPSINAAWKHMVRHGHAITYKTKLAKDFQKQIRKAAPINFKLILTNVKVDINICHKTKRKTDIDNRLKVLLDSLNKVILLDDSQIDELYIKQKIGTGVDLCSIVVVEK